MSNTMSETIVEAVSRTRGYAVKADVGVMTYEIQGISEREDIMITQSQKSYSKYASDRMTVTLGEFQVPMWGERHNLYPQEIHAAVSENKLLPEVIRKQRKFMFGKGPRLYKEIIEGEGDKVKRVRIFALEMKNTSPIFNDLGSKTVATGLPITPNNCRIFGFANRLDIDQKPNSVIEVIVSHGSYTREGVLYLSAGYNTEKSFPITIAFNEGIMYQTMEDLLLSKLKIKPRVFDNFVDILTYMNRLFSQDATDEELSVFNVYLKKEKFTEEFEGNESEQIGWVRLNDPEIYDLSKLQIVDRTDIVVDGELKNISVPQGYGITPFVRVWRILELIFEHFGYKVKSNPFKEHFQLKRLCVLNNVVDAILWNEIDYAQLMPNVTVMEFLESLYCRFGLKVFFDGNKNEVNLRLLKDIFANNDADKMNLGSELDPEIAIPKQIKLTAAKNLEYSKTEFDTYEEFLAKYNNTVDIAIEGQSIRNDGIVLYIKNGFFYQQPIRGLAKKISSIHFDWNKNEEGFEIEEITSVDECITMWEGLSHVPYYAVDARLAYSDLGITKADASVEDKKDFYGILNGENKLAFIYDMGLAYSERDDITYYRGYNYGSIFPYEVDEDSCRLQKDKYGNEFIYSLTMVGEHGAFNQFHKAHDAFLRHSNRLVKFEINALPYELSDIDYSKKKIIQNQPILLDKVDYNIGQEKNMINATIEARSLHLYKPYDLEKEQFISTPEPIFSKWEFYNSRDGRINDKLIERRSYWMRWCEAAGFKFKSYDIAPKSIFIPEPIQDPNPPTDRDKWYLPPTWQQLKNHAKIGESKHNCRIICRLVYEIKMVGDQYEYENFSIDYIGEFNAVPI